MKIVWFSGVFNHHNYPLDDALSSIEGVELYYIQTRKETKERKNLGYHPYQRDYVIDMTLSEENRQKAHDLALDADVMIASLFPYEFLKERLKNKKLTFLCQERMFKGKTTLMRVFRAWFFNVRKFLIFRNKPLYFLSIGRGAASDYKRIGFYKNKKYLWAYFPLFIEYDIDKLIEQKQRERVNVLFAGRFISCKHPEYVLHAIRDLYGKDKNVHLTYLGTGEMENQLKNEAKELVDNGVVEFLGAKTPEEVRTYMEKSNVYAFTSTSDEGWGVVLNEAMNSGCAVVASATAGASTVLIDDGKNGLLYYNDSYDEFFEKFSMLVDDKDLRNELGKSAYLTIKNEVNACVASKRLYSVIRELLYGEKAQEYKGITEKIK